MPQGSDCFAGKHALIFGGAKGIGKALAEEFARRGARLTIADIDEPAAETTAAAVREEGGSARAVHADVLSAASMATAIGRAEDSFGPLDIVVNNVGAILNGHPEDIPQSEWERIGELSYGAVVRSIGAVLPGMLQRGRGHIVNTASFAGIYPYASSRIPYAAAKAATISLSQNLALYCEPKGIRVSCLIPGPVRTGIGATMTSWTEIAQFRGPGSQLRTVEPEEAAMRFADGMAKGQILIASDASLWDIVRHWAKDPDDFIRGRIAAAAAGDLGVPAV